MFSYKAGNKVFSNASSVEALHEIKGLNYYGNKHEEIECENLDILSLVKSSEDVFNFINSGIAVSKK